MPPTVSVVMSVYNGARFVRQAIESILQQSFTDFEFIIINDASTDDTPAILQGHTDRRIVVLCNEENIGLTRSLNRGLAVARGDYIARMDADDISLPGRLMTQVAYMEQHPKVGVLGTNSALIDAQGRLLYKGVSTYGSMPPHPTFLRWALMWRNPLTHTSVMIRRALLDRTGLRYDPAFRTSQDYDLWARLSRHTQLARLPGVYVQSRVVKESISHKSQDGQMQTHYAIMQRELAAKLGRMARVDGIKATSDIIATNVDENTAFDAAATLILMGWVRMGLFCLDLTARAQIRENATNGLLMVAYIARMYNQPYKSILLRAMCLAPFKIWKLYRLKNLPLINSRWQQV